LAAECFVGVSSLKKEYNVGILGGKTMRRFNVALILSACLFLSGCFFDQQSSDLSELQDWQREEIVNDLPRIMRQRFGEWKVRVVGWGKIDVLYSFSGQSLDQSGLVQCYLGQIPVYAEYSEGNERLREKVNAFFVAEFHTDNKVKVKKNIVILNALPDEYLVISRYKQALKDEFQEKWRKEFIEEQAKKQS